MSDRTAIINGLVIDEETGTIRIGRGATGYFSATLSVESGSLDIETDIVLLVVSSRKNSSNGVVIKKQFPIIVNEENEYEVNFSLTNSETKAISVGEYLWNAIVITGPEYDANGEIVIDDSDSVVPFYTDGDRPSFKVEEVGCIV